MTDDPKRLLLTEEGRLAAGLAVARRQGPSDAQLTALAERLVRAGIALPEDVVRGVPRPSAPASAASPRDSGRLAKALLAGLPILSCVMLAAWLLRARAPVEARSDVLRAPSQGALTATPAPALDPTGKAAPPAQSPAVAVEPPIAAGREQKPSDEPPLAEPGGNADPQPAALSAEAPPRTRTEHGAEPKSRSGTSGPTPARSAAVATNPAYDALSDQPGSSSPAATPESEIELLKRARNTLPADPVRALALTERCAEEYPRGAFAQERDFIAISALFRVGRRHEALSRAERFRSSYPRSVYLPQLERMLLAP